MLSFCKCHNDTACLCAGPSADLGSLDVNSYKKKKKHHSTTPHKHSKAPSKHSHSPPKSSHTPSSGKAVTNAAAGGGGNVNPAAVQQPAQQPAQAGSSGQMTMQQAYAAALAAPTPQELSRLKVGHPLPTNTSDRLP